MIEWKEFDEWIAEDISKQYVEDGLLKAHLSVLFAKKMISHQTELQLIQQNLHVKFNVEYSLEDIENELIVMKHDMQDKQEIEEDFFPGY